jgi:hypothetical protein
MKNQAVVTTGYTTFAVSKQDFYTRNQNYSFLFLVFSALFGNAFEALNLPFKNN